MNINKALQKSFEAFLRIPNGARCPVQQAQGIYMQLPGLLQGIILLFYRDKFGFAVFKYCIIRKTTGF